MSDKKQQLINTASELFCYEGFNATGINRILEKANISKMTLYKHFKTKDELILECLTHSHNLFVNDVLTPIDKLDIPAKDKINKLFDIILEFVHANDIIRCLFINASAEFPNLNDPIHKIAADHKFVTEKFVLKCLKEMQAKEPEHLARTITALQQGALVMAQLCGRKEYYHDINITIKKLLDSAC